MIVLKLIGQFYYLPVLDPSIPLTSNAFGLSLSVPNMYLKQYKCTKLSLVTIGAIHLGRYSFNIFSSSVCVRKKIGFSVFIWIIDVTKN